jgi:hypothetical protein
MECEVLRCGSPAQSFFDVGNPRSGPIDVGVCQEHQAQIEQDAHWLYAWEAPAGARLLIGEDLMPRVVKLTTRRFTTVGGEKTRAFTFEAVAHDGSPRDIDIELPPEMAESVWRVLTRDREQDG